jgi:hypothetical protein
LKNAPDTGKEAHIAPAGGGTRHGTVGASAFFEGE